MDSSFSSSSCHLTGKRSLAPPPPPTSLHQTIFSFGPFTPSICSGKKKRVFSNTSPFHPLPPSPEKRSKQATGKLFYNAINLPPPPPPPPVFLPDSYHLVDGIFSLPSTTNSRRHSSSSSSSSSSTVVVLTDNEVVGQERSISFIQDGVLEAVLESIDKEDKIGIIVPTTHPQHHQEEEQNFVALCCDYEEHFGKIMDKAWEMTQFCGGAISPTHQPPLPPHFPACDGRPLLTRLIRRRRTNKQETKADDNKKKEGEEDNDSSAIIVMMNGTFDDNDILPIPKVVSSKSILQKVVESMRRPVTVTYDTGEKEDMDGKVHDYVRTFKKLSTITSRMKNKEKKKTEEEEESSGNRENDGGFSDKSKFNQSEVPAISFLIPKRISS